jgi:hypothetical protein
MPTYQKQFGGYIADVPRMWFKRCDGRIFYFDELTAATVSPQINYTEVNAGWSLYPVAYLPGQSTFEMQITSGKFEADLFVMTNSTEFAKNSSYQMPATEVLTPNGNHIVELAHNPVASSISITWPKERDNDTGLMVGVASQANLASGKYFLTAATESSPATIEFFDGDIPGDVTINYLYEVTSMEANIDNRSSAIGEAILVYPVYGDAADCEIKSSIIGNVIMKVYKARVTAQPGLDGSYKTASTYQFTLSAMDAKRPDDATYSIAYIKN